MGDACFFEYLLCLYNMAHRVEEGHAIVSIGFHGLTILPAMDSVPAISYMFDMVPVPIMPVKLK